MLACAVGVGLLNGSLIRFAKFTPVAATLVTYIGLGGLAFTLRSAPDGYIAASVTDAISTKVGPVPIAFVVFVLCAVGLELGLRKTQFGLRLRAVGSDEESARRVGVPVNRTALLGYLGASLLTLLGAVVLLAQLGVGDPGQGTGYTLTSITAVVLGGTSLLGGRGTFIGTLMGAGLSVQVLNATVFLSLDQKWQYIFQGLLIVAAAIIYSQVRRSGATRAGSRVVPAADHDERTNEQRSPHAQTNAPDAPSDARPAAPRDPAPPRHRPARARAPARSVAELDLADRDRQDPPVRAHAVRVGVGVRRHGRRGALQRGAAATDADASPSARTRRRPAPEPGLAVQRAVERPAITLNSGVKWERLMFWDDEDVEFIEATYEPGGASSPDDAFVRHNGHEFGFVLSGTLRVVVGFDEFILEPGDSITFPSSTPHRLSNDGAEAVRAVWVVRGRRGAEGAQEASETSEPRARQVKSSGPAKKDVAR